MAEIKNTDQTIRQIHDNLDEIVKDMTLEKRCQYIFERAKEFHKKQKNNQSTGNNNETPKM
ncbi:MAG: hypothetical protein LBI18_05660 [Planctomycetaceae bacterium]|jgi:hypothetical protein|nr:hypothetical protein [Planctomycetaceae bacterium]